MRRLIWVLMLLCLPAVDVYAGPMVAADGQIESFLQRDMTGARLSSYSRGGGVSELVVWTKEPDWQVLVVVSDYNAQPVRRTPNGVQAIVEYTVLGELVKETWVPRKSQKNKRISFILEQTGEVWKIARPILPPHISLERAIAEVKTRLDKPAGDRKETLEVSLASLEALRQEE